MRVRLGKVRAFAAVAASVLLALAIVTQRRSAAAAADRLTLIAVWSGANYQPYFRHLIASARLNADAVDLLIINRMDEDAGSGTPECLDLAAHGIDLSQDTNIRLHCMSDIDWKVRHIDFLCSARYGWDCNDEERDGVAKAMMGSKDRLNCEWKPFRGYIFRDLFLRPWNPLWAWVDLDMHFGKLSAYPFAALRRSTLITGFYAAPQRIFMAGQFTAFNMDDPTLATAWKSLEYLRSPQRFARGRWHKGASDESYWSRAFLGADEDSVGDAISWAVIGDMHGQDWFDALGQSFLVSGHDVIQLQETMDRRELETLLSTIRAEPDRSPFGAHFLPTSSAGARWTAAPLARLMGARDQRQERVPLLHGEACSSSWIPMEYSQCVATNTTLLGVSRMAGRDTRGTVLAHTATARPAKAYSERLFLHYQWLKQADWFQFPPFDITPAHIMLVSADRVEVFKMGANRQETLFIRSRESLQDVDY